MRLGEGEPTLGVPADPRGAAEARDQDLRDDGPDDPAASWPGPCSPPGRPNVDRVPPVTGGGDPRDRLLHRRDDQAHDALRPVLHRALDPARVPGRRQRAPRLGVGHLSKPGTSPSTSGSRVFGSSSATGTPRSADRSMRCSAPRASGSFERRSAHLGRTHSRSGSFEDRAPRVPRPRPDLRSSAPRASARGVRRALRGGETPSGTELGRARRYPNTAGPGDSPNAGRTKGRARRSDPRVSLGGVIRIVEPFRLPRFRETI